MPLWELRTNPQSEADDMDDRERKELLKNMRESRRESIDRIKERIKKTNKDLRSIKDRLAQGPGTIPELAEATGLPTASVLWYIAALRKYGQVAEGAKARSESYYPYELIRESKPADSVGAEKEK